MRRKKGRFRITRKGKIVITLLSAALIFAGAYILGIVPEMKITHGSTPGSSIVNASVDVDNKKNETTEETDSKDNNSSSIINKPDEAPEAAAGVNNDKSNNTTNNTATNTSKDNKKPGEAIDEEFFNKALFIGDSITEGISAYGLLDDKNVLAVKGLTISKAEKEMDRIVKRHPEKIYILLGSNDMLYGMDSEKFSSHYIEFIQNIKDKLPETKIYIQSIFPVAKNVESKKPLLANPRIDEFNSVLKKKAEEQGITYIDISSLLKDGSGVMNKDYTSDGIHVKYKFYSIWLNCVKENS